MVNCVLLATNTCYHLQHNTMYYIQFILCACEYSDSLSPHDKLLQYILYTTLHYTTLQKIITNFIYWINKQFHRINRINRTWCKINSFNLNQFTEQKIYRYFPMKWRIFNLLFFHSKNLYIITKWVDSHTK